MMKTLARIKHFPMWFLIFIFALVVLRLLTPPIGKWAINKALNEKMGTYTGHIDDFDLSLYRGAYQLQGLTIQKRDSKLEPILAVKEIDLSLAWRALLRKELTGDITVNKMVVHLAKSSDESKSQLGMEESKLKRLDIFDVIVPIHIESLKVMDSAVYFVNGDLKKPLPVSIEKIELTAKDLRTRDKKTNIPFTFEALVQQHARLNATGMIDVLGGTPRGNIDFKLTGFKPSTVNQLMRAYVPIDITTGRLDVYGETAFEKGDAVGYTKVFLKDADVIANKQSYVSPKHFFFEIFGAFGSWILENNKDRKIASYVPFEYHDKKLNVNSSKAFWSAVENKWDRLKMGIDNSITMASLHKHDGNPAKVLR